MSSELKIDNSKEVFKLDKEILSFNINLGNLSEQEPIKSSLKSENEIKITNLTDDYLAFRTKTTKKIYYNVQPIYCILPPKETKTIKITFFLKEGEIPKLSGHKFKFEGFVISESEKDKDAKDLFNDYLNKGESVVGNSQKTFVQFTNGEVVHDKNHLQLPNPTHVRSGSDISEYVDIDENNENEEKKELLMDQIKSNEEQKTTLSDIVSGGTSVISEIKKEEKTEEKKEDNFGHLKLEDKIEPNEKTIVNKVDVSLNKSGKIEEAINNFFRSDLYVNFSKDHSEILTYISLFILMLIGYYLVK